MNGSDLDRYLAAARTHDVGSGHGRFRRVVVRMPAAEVERVDAVRKRFPKASRAALIRAFTLAALAHLDALYPPAPVPDGCVPEGSAP